jgi:hypothetical protein
MSDEPKPIDGASWQVPDYPWDRWEEHARAAGVDERMAQLGREVMREAYQHQWSPELAARCGWDERNGKIYEREIAPGIAPAGLFAAASASGRWIVDVQNCRQMIDQARERPEETRASWRHLLDTDGERGRWDDSTGEWVPSE